MNKKSNIVHKKLKITNMRGMHARVAVKISDTLKDYSSQVFFSHNQQDYVHADSVMGVIMMGAKKGDDIGVYAQGDDAHDVLKALESLFASRFGEVE